MALPPQLRSHLAERLLHLDGKPFSLADYPFYHSIYNGRYQGLLLKTGRQVAKSTTLCNFLICEALSMPHFRSLYISPTQEQTRKFSHTRIAKVLRIAQTCDADSWALNLSTTFCCVCCPTGPRWHSRMHLMTRTAHVVSRRTESCSMSVRTSCTMLLYL